MKDTRTNRSVVFRQAYWGRIEELVALLDEAGQEQAVTAARAARLGRKTVRRFQDVARAVRPGPLTIDGADEVAKRYALWETRRMFDWGFYPQGVQPATRSVDEALSSGIYELDVTLRREVETLLRTSTGEVSTRAASLRVAVEATAGRLAADLRIAATMGDQLPDWARINDDFDIVCNELDALLRLVGSQSAGT